MSTTIIAAPYVGMADATLTIDGDRMTLKQGERVIADADGFRSGACGELDAATFASFLGAAVENLRYGDGEFAAQWDTLADDADEWADAMALACEDPYGTCERCGDPIDYCQGHGDPIDVEEPARMTCRINGVTFVWSGGEYVETGYIATERGPYEIDHGHAVGEFVAQDCVNVWDHANGQPRIARTLDAFETVCREWIGDRS